SCSASRISFRPNSASPRSFTLNGSRPTSRAAAKAWTVSIAVLTLLSSTLGCLADGSPRARSLERSGNPHLLTLRPRGRSEQHRSLRIRIRRELHVTRALHAGFLRPSDHLLPPETQPEVPHPRPVPLALVRHQIHHQDPPTRPEHPHHLTQHPHRIRGIMQHQEEDRGIQL